MTNQLSSRQSQKGFAPILILVLVAVVAVAGFVGYSALRQSQTTQTSSAPVKKNAPIPVIKRRSKDPNKIVSAVFAKDVDKVSGKPVMATNKFSTTDKKVSLVLGVSSVKPGTKIAYLRYWYNPKTKKYVFIDQKSVVVTKANSNYVSFDWLLGRTSKPRTRGIYLVKLYTNGKLDKVTSYVVK